MNHFKSQIASGSSLSLWREFTFKEAALFLKRKKYDEIKNTLIVQSLLPKLLSARLVFSVWTSKQVCKGVSSGR